MSTLIWWWLGYLFHILVMKFLDPNLFSEFGSIMNIFNILSVFTTGFLFFVIKEISIQSENTMYIKKFLKVLFKYVFLFSILLFGIYSLFAKNISDFLHIKPVFFVLSFGVIIVINFVKVLIDGTFQWLLNIKYMIYNNISISIYKILFGLWWLYIGFGIYSLIWWVIAGIVFWIFVSFCWLVFYLHQISKNKEYEQNIDKDAILSNLKKNIQNIGQFLFLSIILSILMNMDILIVQHFFVWQQISNIYAWLSTIAKIVVFLGMSIDSIYYPQIIKSIQNSDISTVPRHLYRNLFLIFFLLWVSSIVFSFFFGDFILSKINNLYFWYSDILIYILIYNSFYICLYSICKILIWNTISIVNYILGVLMFLWIWYLYFFYDIGDILDIVYFLLFFIIIVFLTILVFAVFYSKKNKKPQTI